MRKLVLAAVMASVFCTPAMARQKQFTAAGYSLPADKPLTILVMRPDVQVGQLQTGGAIEPNADWTAAARTHLDEALTATSKARGIDLRPIGASSADSDRLVADYEALHRAVATAIIVHKIVGAKLPTKKDKFDWTLGPGAQKLGELSGANYALFFYGRDNFASSGRKALQVAGMLGCLVGFCVIASGGQHDYYASLVELSTGNIVWFNLMRGSEGDVREGPGAQAMVDAILSSMPTKPGQPVAVAVK
ncbi:hypothetical protein QH494_08940 [Sphingomonas sp. AR_OL41]|uniref:hypothetical protein n=1 Tax=Sphingomonas sp. AR_OL41 TaxID=3042729 RepID=UPI002480BB73|nr:hypothetical protein [Sphingomonas sp. AR_OL41]MDH7972305.1 hypothetical protein [Sphingomonas sp. AR_OL41]